MDNLSQLLEKYKNGTCSDKELIAIDYYFHHFELQQDLQLSETELAAVRSEMWMNIAPEQPLVKKLWFKVAAAAAIAAIILSVGVYFNSLDQNRIDSRLAQQEIKPGKSAATLILADGRKVKLGDKGTKSVFVDGTNVATANSNLLSYTVTDQASVKNTLITANAEQFALRLPDGTEVWLNAASSLTYETNINARGQRVVYLEGEAYFQVAKDKAHPFLVQTADQLVEVYGTHFNVSSYAADQLTATTLLEGSVSVSANGQTLMLKPGEQAKLQDKKLRLKAVDAAYAASWKDGFFMFDHEELVSVMNKLARWYGIKVVYLDESVKRETFFGTISRAKNITNVLEHLSKTKTLKFSVDQNVVYVSSPANRH